jgi:hypothetical protein
MRHLHKTDHHINGSFAALPLSPIQVKIGIEMLTFSQFIEEIAQRDLTIPASEVKRMRERYGDKLLRIGHLQEDGSMLVPIDCVIEASQSLGSGELASAARTLKSDEVAQMLQSGETLIERVGDARESKLRELIRTLQSEPDENNADRQWKRIEKMVFGVDYPD